MPLLKKVFIYSISALLVLLLLLITLAPPIVRWAVEDWLQDEGVEAQFDHLSMTLGLGRIEIVGLRGEDAQARGFGLDELILDVELLPLMSRRIVIEQVEVNGLRLDVVTQPDDMIVGGLSLAKLSAGDEVELEQEVSKEEAVVKDWAVELHRLAINNVKLCVAQEADVVETHHCIALDSLLLEGGIDVPSLQNIQVNLPESVVLKGVSVTDKLQQITLLTLSKLAVESLHYEAAGGGLDGIVLDELSLSGLEQDISDLGLMSVSGGFESFQLNGLSWQPDNVLDPQDWGVTFRGFAIKATKFCATKLVDGKSDPQCLGFEQLLIDGGLSVPSVNELQVEMPGTLTLSGFNVEDQLYQLGVMSLDELKLKALNYQTGGLTLDQVVLNKLKLLERHEAMLRSDSIVYHGGLDKLQLNELAWQPEVLSIDTVNVGGLDLLLHRDEQATLPIIRLLELLLKKADPAASEVADQQLASQDVTSSEEAATPAEARPAMAVIINQFTIGEGSKLSVIDEGIQPVLVQTLSDLQLHVTSINGQQPNKASPAKLSARMGEFGMLRVKAKTWPFREKLNLELQGEIDAFDLLPFTGYLEQAIGYQVQSGQLNSELDVSVEEDMVDADVNLELNKFELLALEKALRQGSAEVRVSASGEAQETESSALPIGLALNLLKDDNGKIYLELPVSGPVGDPSLSFSYVVSVVMRKAMTAAVMNYYAPLGILNIASGLMKSATELRFEPMLFDPGQSSLTGFHRDRLRKMAQLLSEKSQLSLSFCASASGADALSILQLPAAPEAGLVLTLEQREELRVLASERGSVVKENLLEMGAGSAQVVLCQPDLALDRFEPAEMEVSL